MNILPGWMHIEGKIFRRCDAVQQLILLICRTELCLVVVCPAALTPRYQRAHRILVPQETMFSGSYLFQVTGDIKYADKVSRHLGPRLRQ